MIPVQGVQNQTIAVLGLGRSGRATVAALVAGGARVVVWDDGADTRAQAEQDGMTVLDLTREAHWDGIEGLLANAFNDIVAADRQIARELDRVGDTVGRQGRLRERINVINRQGAWLLMEQSVNRLLDDLVPKMLPLSTLQKVLQNYLILLHFILLSLYLVYYGLLLIHYTITKRKIILLHIILAMELLLS